MRLEHSRLTKFINSLFLRMFSDMIKKEPCLNMRLSEFYVILSGAADTWFK